MVEKNHANPNTLYPIEGVTRTVYLKNIITNPQIIVGDYTYYDDPEDVHNFEKNILYLFDFMGDKLIIGKFCQIATGVRFIMNGSNHAMNGFSTYPFKVFGGEWAEKDPITDLWRTNSIRVPHYLVYSVRFMIYTGKSVSEILLFIRKNKNKRENGGK